MTAARNGWSLGGTLCCLCIALAPLGALPALAKPVYTMLPPGTEAYGISDAGVVTGSYLVKGAVTAGFLRTPDGIFTTFHVPGDTYGTYPVGINADGAITGNFEDKKQIRGFVRSPDGTITVFDGPGAGGWTFPLCITASGAVGGYFYDAYKNMHGFVRAPDGTMSKIDAPPASSTMLTAINAKGVVAGNYLDANGRYHGFVRNDDGKTATFDLPGTAPVTDRITGVAGINDRGEITGTFNDARAGLHAYVRSAGGAFTIFDAADPNTESLAINSRGWTTGFGYAAVGTTIGFIRKHRGAITSFAVPGADAGTHPMSINEAGVVAGTAWVYGARHNPRPTGFIRTP